MLRTCIQPISYPHHPHLASTLCYTSTPASPQPTPQPLSPSSHGNDSRPTHSPCTSSLPAKPPNELHPVLLTCCVVPLSPLPDTTKLGVSPWEGGRRSHTPSHLHANVPHLHPDPGAAFPKAPRSAPGTPSNTLPACTRCTSSVPSSLHGAGRAARLKNMELCEFTCICI